MWTRLLKLPLAELSALTGLFALLFLADQTSAVTVSWQFCLVALLLGLGIVLPNMWHEGKGMVGLFAAFGASVVVLHCTSFSPVKPFTRLSNGIHNGMTSGQVQELFVQNFPDDGRFAQPVGIDTYGSQWSDELMAEQPTHTLHYTLNPDDARYDAETLTIYFERERVVSTSYLPD